MSSKGLLNLSIKGTSIAGKFLLIFFLGKYISTEEIGVYSLIVTYLMFIVYFVGLELHTFTNRAIIQNKNSEVLLINNQIYIHLCMYIISIFSLFLILFYSGIEYPIIIKFCILLFIPEHLNTECFRILILKSRQTQANLIQTFKNLWTYIIIAFLYFNPDIITIDLIGYAWLINSILAVFINLYLVQSDIKITNIHKPDFSVIKKIISGGIIFLIASIANKIIDVSDRLLIEHYLNIKQTGIYSFFYTIINGMDIIIYSSIIIMILPKLIESKKEPKQLYIYSKKLGKSILISSILLAILLIIIFPYVIKWTGNSDFSNNSITFFLILAGIFISVNSYSYHYKLYALGKDKLLIIVALIAMCLNVILNLILIPALGINGAAISTILSYLFIFGIKLAYTLKEESSDYESSVY